MNFFGKEGTQPGDKRVEVPRNELEKHREGVKLAEEELKKAAEDLSKATFKNGVPKEMIEDNERAA